MQFTTLITALAVAAGATAAPALQQQRDGGRVAQFRIFSAPGCSELNQGFYTVDNSDADTCKPLTDLGSGPGVLSVNLESWTASPDCSISVFTDGACSAGKRELGLNTCVDSEEGSFGSYQLTCFN